MQGMPSSISREPWSELKVADLLRPLAFGTSFEELAIFLIDKIAEKKLTFLGPALNAHRSSVLGSQILVSEKHGEVPSSPDRDGTSDRGRYGSKELMRIHHPDRDAPFDHANEKVAAAQAQ
jgi:hypothetical protein